VFPGILPGKYYDETGAGIELTVGYEELPPKGDLFESKSVAILGLGNAAFETANAAENYAN